MASTIQSFVLTFVSLEAVTMGLDWQQWFWPWSYNLALVMALLRLGFLCISSLRLSTNGLSLVSFQLWVRQLWNFPSSLFWALKLLINGLCFIYIFSFASVEEKLHHTSLLSLRLSVCLSMRDSFFPKLL